MKITDNLTLVNFNAGSGTGRIKYIVIHFTANDGDTALNNTNYFKSVNRGASAHYFVDENGICRCVLDEDIAWHCGTSGTYKHPSCRNTNSIGIELCSRKDSKGNYYFKDATVANAVELVRELMAKYNVPVQNVIRHYDVTGKICPAPYVSDSGAWAAFLGMLTEKKEEPELLSTMLIRINDGKIVEIPSVKRDGYNYPDFRELMKLMGYNIDEYDKNTKVTKISKEMSEMILSVNGGEPVVIPSVMINGSNHPNLRALGKELGCMVAHNDANGVVTINK